MSYLARHRTICAVLQEMKQIAIDMPSSSESKKIAKLCDEAEGYAKRMDAKLTEIRYKENTNGKDE